MATEAALKSDLASLHELNRDYVRSVQTSDVRRFDEMLADDFQCSNPDGSQVDRTAFLQQTARPVAGRLGPRHPLLTGYRLRADVLADLLVSSRLLDSSTSRLRPTPITHHLSPSPHPSPTFTGVPNLTQNLSTP